MMTTLMVEKKPLDYYIRLEYPVTLEAAPEGGYFIQIEELPGCYAQGETVEEAVEMIQIAKKLWMESMYEDGMEIPEPESHQEFSGKFFIRAPKSLHRALDRMADREGVSLNQFLVATLAKAIGIEEGRQTRARPKKRAAPKKNAGQDKAVASKTAIAYNQ